MKGLFAADEWQSKLGKSDRGTLIECWQNIYMICKFHPAWKGVLAFDAFSQVPVKLKDTPTGSPAGEWTPQDEYLLGLWLSHQLDYTVRSLLTINTGVMACANSSKFHPITDWLNTLTWDGTERLAHWLNECLGVKQDEYSATVGRYFILNMVARVFDPGCIMRYVPVLEGAQNRGKSTALRILGGEWYSDAHLELTSKDAFELIQGTWLQEIAEMGAFNKSEANRVKHFVSTPDDTWVPKYVRGRQKVKRQVVFAGTTNEKQYLKDWTGNTRYLPLRCMEDGDIELRVLEGMREQLFAEAVVLLRAGARRYATAEEEARLFVPHQDERQVDHPWREPILAYLYRPEIVLEPTFQIGTHELLTKALHVDTSKLTLMMQQDVGRIMDSLGWARQREGGGQRRWFYVRPEKRDETSSEKEGESDDLPI